MSLVIPINPFSTKQSIKRLKHLGISTKEGHSSTEIRGVLSESQLNSRQVSKGNSKRPKGRHKHPHAHIIKALWVGSSRGKLKGPVDLGEPAAQGHQHLPEGWMNIKIKHPSQVVAGKLAKVSLIPPTFKTNW